MNELIEKNGLFRDNKIFEVFYFSKIKIIEEKKWFLFSIHLLIFNFNNEIKILQKIKDSFFELNIIQFQSINFKIHVL